MKKIIIFILLIQTLLLSETEYQLKTISKSEVRDCPVWACSTIKVLKKNTTLRSTKFDGSSYYIEKYNGWIESGSIKIISKKNLTKARKAKALKLKKAKALKLKKAKALKLKKAKALKLKKAKELELKKAKELELKKAKELELKKAKESIFYEMSIFSIMSIIILSIMISLLILAKIKVSIENLKFRK